MPSITPFRALAVICAAQGLGLVAYAVYVVVASALTGTTGSSAVSNPGAMIVLAVTLGIFGAGLLLIARAWWLRATWQRGAFVMAQIVGGIIGYSISQADQVLAKYAGLALVLMAAAGLVLVFSPPVLGHFTRKD